MNENDWLSAQFEENRAHLRAVAYRVLGSMNEAEDAVQESWFRLSRRSDTASIENLGGWLTTVVARVCLNMLRSRNSRRKDPTTNAPIVHRQDGVDPEHEALQADSVGLALLVVLETLTPAERLAFVLLDMFAVPFDEIAPIVDRSPAAARQLASRGRRQVQGSPAMPGTDLNHQRQVVDAFLAASRRGDFEALLSMLDPDVILRADPATASMGAAAEVGGPAAVAEAFSDQAKAAKLALVDGLAGAVWSAGGQPRIVFAFTVLDGLVAGIELLSDADHLRELELEILDD
jgi:RNA polymerase sigma-70 factor (ECF subfamily)